MTVIEILHIWFTIFLLFVVAVLSIVLWVINQAYTQLQKDWRTQGLLLGREKRRNKSLQKQLNQKDKPNDKHYGC